MLANLLSSVLSRMRLSFLEEGFSMAGPEESQFKKFKERRRTSDGIPLLAKRKADPKFRNFHDLSDLHA